MNDHPRALIPAQADEVARTDYIAAELTARVVCKRCGEELAQLGRLDGVCILLGFGTPETAGTVVHTADHAAGLRRMFLVILDGPTAGKLPPTFPVVCREHRYLLLDRGDALGAARSGNPDDPKTIRL